MDEALEALRDIHGPADPATWPLAPGWYLLVLLAIVGVAVAGFLAWRVLRSRRPRRRALATLDAIAARHDPGVDQAAVAAEVSALLRRAAIFRFGRETVGGLTGRRWIEFLEETGGEFSPHAEAMASAYRPASKHDVRPLLDSARRWIGRNLG